VKCAMARPPRPESSECYQTQESRAAYEKAIELAGNTAEFAYLTRRRDQQLG